MDEIIIRKARPEDALGIAIVHMYTWKTTYTGFMPEDLLDSMVMNIPQRAEQWKTDIENGKTCFVAETMDTVIGFVSCGPARGSDAHGTGETLGFYILKPFQRHGIGRRLLRKCMDALREQGCTRMVVNCLRGNPALSFYQAMGGRITGQRQDAIPGGCITEDVLEFDL